MTEEQIEDAESEGLIKTDLTWYQIKKRFMSNNDHN